MENTTINKAKFFALYLECAMCDFRFIAKEENYIALCSPTQVMAVKYGQQSVPNRRAVNKIKTAHLLLKPLSQISDEDSIAVANIVLGISSGVKVVGRYDRKIELESRNSDFSIWFDGEFSMSEYGLSSLTVMKAYDYLRSKGYMVKFNGLSPEKIIEYGWAKYPK